MKRKMAIFSYSLMILIMLLSLGLPTVAAQDPITVTIDIKPCRDPNPLNVNAGGVLPVAIYYGDSNVNPETITLEGVPALDWWRYKEDYLVVKFDAQAVIATLGEVEDGDTLTLTLWGTMDDGTPFTGQDDIVILKRGKHWK